MGEFGWERIMTSNHAIAVVPLLFLLTVAAGSSLQQSGSDQTRAARVVLRVLATPESGPAVERASSDVELAPGQSGSIVFATAADLCGFVIGGTGAGAQIASPRHVWTARFTLVSARTDRIAVDVDVERRDDAPQAVRRMLRHLVLTEGDPHVIDFVEGGDGSCATANMVIETSAAMIESAPVRQVLSYDLWLTHRDANGREWVRHETRTAPQGERVDFRFAPLAWSTRAMMPSLRMDETIDEHVFGSIRGRLGADGQVEVSLTAARGLV